MITHWPGCKTVFAFFQGASDKYIQDVWKRAPGVSRRLWCREETCGTATVKGCYRQELMSIKKKEKTLMRVFYWLLPEEKRLRCPHKHMSQSWVFLQSRQCGGKKKASRWSHCPAGVKYCVVWGLKLLLKCGFAAVSLPVFVLINDAAISWATKQNKKFLKIAAGIF